MRILLVKVVLDDFYDKWTLSDDNLLKRVISPINAGVKIEMLKEQEKKVWRGQKKQTQSK